MTPAGKLRRDIALARRDGRIPPRVYRGTIRNRAPTNRQLNKKIKKIQRDEELKFLRQNVRIRSDNDASVAFSATASLLINNLGTGTAATQRIANEVRATSVKMRISVTWDAALSLVNVPKIRMLMFWDSMPNQSNPEVFGTLNSASLLTTDLAVPPLLAMYNHNNVKKRYKVLWDQTFTPRAYQYTAPSVQVHTINIVKKIKLNRRVLYDDTTTNITALSANALWFYVMSDNTPLPLTNNPIIDTSFQFFYKD